MATTQTQGTAGLGAQEAFVPKLMVGEAVGEVICGLAAVVLAVIGLAHAEWGILTPITAIIVGAALILQGASTMSRSASVALHGPRESLAAPSMECIGGIVGVILGVLAILGVAPSALMSSAAIVFGASLIVSSVISNQFHSLYATDGTPTSESMQFAQRPDVIFVASGPEALVGLAATVLGVVSLIGEDIPNATLTLVALLIVGTYVVLMSTEFARRMMHIPSHG